MRLLYLILPCFFLFGNLYAQLPNESFDDWATISVLEVEYDSLASYDNPNRITTYLGGDSSDLAVRSLSNRLDLGMAPIDGSDALVLETKTFNVAGLLDLDIPGIVSSRSLSIDLFSGTGWDFFDDEGTPFTDRPTSFDLQYKYNPVPGDLLYAQVELFSNGTLIGFGSFETGSASGTWAPMSINMAYSSSVFPDTIRFAITSSKNFSPFATGAPPAASGSLAIIDGLGSLCSPTVAPGSPTTSVLSDGLMLSWDPVSGSESCRVRVVPGGGSSLFRFLPAGQYSLFVADSKIAPGTTFLWSVLCACSLVPPILTPETTPLSYSARMGDWPTSQNVGEAYPNPASQSVCLNMFPAGTTVLIHDMVGRLLANQQVGAGSMVDLTNLPTGHLLIVGPDGISIPLVHTP